MNSSLLGQHAGSAVGIMVLCDLRYAISMFYLLSDIARVCYDGCVPVLVSCHQTLAQL
jgi:hypothetical protein